MNRQFDTTSIVCPCCGHVFGEQAYFQSFETKIAGWLGAKVAPPATPGYDVCDSPHFPDKTFQVKYSQAYGHPKSKLKYPPLSWTWKMKRLNPIHPDFFVLFGIEEDGTENVFLLSRADFFKFAYHTKEDHWGIVTSAKKESNKRYRYIPKIWRYVVRNPHENLVESIRNYAPKTQDSMFMEVHKQNLDEIRALRASGMSLKAVGERFGISEKSIQRLLQGHR